jgi:NAD(P)-dependent dehydrogenase (short-subunit alcohol dehydrogenase family)
MAMYAVTGAASGMGKAVADKLRAAEHTVIGVDLRDVEVIADLSTAAGRATASAVVLERAGGRLDGAVLAAGLGPTNDPGRVHLIAEVNYFGVVELLKAWRPALADAGTAKVVVFSSNSTTTVPAVPRGVIRAFLRGNGPAAERAASRFGKRTAPAMAYAGSKIAVSHWLRTNATTAEWAGAGIRLNAIAPGAILTPLLREQLEDPATADAIHRFPVPIGGYGDPSALADWVVFMLGPSADFLCGSIIYVDGGTDAYFRASDWPRAPGLLATMSYLRRMKSFSSHR